MPLLAILRKMKRRLAHNEAARVSRVGPSSRGFWGFSVTSSPMRPSDWPRWGFLAAMRRGTEDVTCAGGTPIRGSTDGCPEVYPNLSNLCPRCGYNSSLLVGLYLPHYSHNAGHCPHWGGQNVVKYPLVNGPLRGPC